MDRNEIDARLQKLRADLPSMLAESEDCEDFWPALLERLTLSRTPPAARTTAVRDQLKLDADAGRPKDRV